MSKIRVTRGELAVRVHAGSDCAGDDDRIGLTEQENAMAKKPRTLAEQRAEQKLIALKAAVYDLRSALQWYLALDCDAQKGANVPEIACERCRVIAEKILLHTRRLL